MMIDCCVITVTLITRGRSPLHKRFTSYYKHEGKRKKFFLQLTQMQIKILLLKNYCS